MKVTSIKGEHLKSPVQVQGGYGSIDRVVVIKGSGFKGLQVAGGVPMPQGSFNQQITIANRALPIISWNSGMIRAGVRIGHPDPVITNTWVLEIVYWEQYFKAEVFNAQQVCGRSQCQAFPIKAHAIKPKKFRTRNHQLRAKGPMKLRSSRRLR